MAAQWYQRAAEQGDADAQYNLGSDVPIWKAGVAQDDKVAAQWYQRAAEQGDAECSVQSGL